MTPTFRYHPSIVAQAFGTLGALFPGRVMLGVGTGESLNEVPARHRMAAVKERLARLREAIALIRRLWREERVSFEGDYYRTESATIYDRPEEPVPIYVAASGPAVAEARRPGRRRLHLHQRQGAASSTPRRCCRRSPRGRESGPRPRTASTA